MCHYVPDEALCESLNVASLHSLEAINRVVGSFFCFCPKISVKLSVFLGLFGALNAIFRQTMVDR